MSQHRCKSNASNAHVADKQEDGVEHNIENRPRQQNKTGEIRGSVSTNKIRHGSRENTERNPDASNPGIRMGKGHDEIRRTE